MIISNAGLFVIMFFSFLAGFLACVATLLIWGLFRVRKLDKKIKELREKFVPTLRKSVDPTVKTRLDRAFDITEQQLGIMGALDMPQSSASHGKYKNDLISQLKSLEKEKLDILKSILNDGYNPSLVVLNASTNEKEKITLKDFVARYDDVEDDTPPPPPPPAKPTFKVISGNKDAK